MNYANFSGKGRKCLVAFFVLIFAFSFSPAQAQASSGFFEGIWCDITGLLGFTCEVPIEAQVLESEVSEATPPPLQKPDDYQIVNSVSEVPAPNTTVVEEHNTYTTNPTTVIYQNSSNEITDSEFLDLFHKLANLISKTGQQGSVVSYDLFDKQIDKVFDRNSENVDNVQEEIRTLSTDITNSFTTDLLTVSGNATVGSDLVVTGSITAGVLDVTALSSAGALIAPYFTATNTTATSTFMGAVGIGTLSPSTKLDVAGNINISAGSAYTYNGANVITASTTLNNFFFGEAGNLTMTGVRNTASGFQALSSNINGSENTAIGYRSLYLNTTGGNNTAIGTNSLYSNTTGVLNTAVGVNTLYSNSSGSYNTASGLNTLYYNTTGSYNTANGYQALFRNISGSYNSAFGLNALSNNTTGSSNIAFGYYTLFSNTTGAYNVAIGRNAGYEINTATSTGANTVIGYNTGRGIVTGVNNTIIGANVTGLSSTLSNNIIIADGAGNQRINVGSTGNVGIGTTTPTAKLTITQSADSSIGGIWLSTSNNTDFRSQYMNTSGVLSFYGGDTAGTLNTATLNAAGEWTNASDISYKENIEKLSYGLDTVLALQPRSYDIKGTDNHRIGFIAQEVEEVIPEVVSGEDGSKGISYGNLVAVAINAIQELAQKVNGFAESITTKFISTESLDTNQLNSNQVETNTLCIGQTCITEAELIKFIEETKQSPVTPIEPNSTLETPVESSPSESALESEETTEEPLPVEESEAETTEPSEPTEEILNKAPEAMLI